jgi:hypothetical protein
MSGEQALRTALATQGRVIALAGAGVTRAATNDAPAATWLDLLKVGIDRVLRDRSPEDNSWRAAVEALLALESPRSYIHVAGMIIDELGPRYERWLEQTVGSLRPDNPEVPEALLGLGISVTTTNFDTLLEQVGGLRSATWRDPGHMLRVLDGDTTSIAHLHGVWDAATTVVFGDKGYEDVLRDQNTQFLLRMAAASKSLLFVGVGKGGNDPNIGGLLDWVVNKAPWSRFDHYWLCLNRDRGEIDRRGAAVPVPYGDDYDDLAGFLRDLAPDRPVITIPCEPVAVPADTSAAVVEPWLTTYVSGPWTALTVDHQLWVLSGSTDVLCHTTEGPVRCGIADLCDRPLRDLALVPDGSHLVAHDAGGFRVWTVNLDGSLTPSGPPFAFRHDAVSVVHVQLAGSYDPAICLLLAGGDVPALRLESTGRVIPRAVAGDGTLSRRPLRDCATGGSVTVHAALDGTTLRLRREEPAGSVDLSLNVGDGATRVTVARPLHDGAAPFAVVVDWNGQLSAWRWQDLGSGTEPQLPVTP